MKTRKTMRDLLEGHPFFQTLSSDQLDLVAGCGSNVRFDAGALVFKEGDPADAFYLVREGRIAIEIPSPGSEPITVITVEAGEVFGYSWLFPPHRYSFDARALETTRAISLDGKCLRTKCEEDHDLGYAFVTRFAQVVLRHLQATRIQLLDLYGPKS